MSERFPASEADPSFVQELEVYIQNVHGDQLAFEWKGENDTLFGPYPALLHSPGMAPGFWSLAKASFSSDAIKPRSRELAILGLLSIINAPYVVYSHRLIARALGLSDQQYDKGLTGATPEGLDEEESMAYKLGRILADLKGPMNDDAWNEAVGKMGKKAVLAVTHIIGGYFYIAMLTNINGRDKRFE